MNVPPQEQTALMTVGGGEGGGEGGGRGMGCKEEERLLVKRVSSSFSSSSSYVGDCTLPTGTGAGGASTN